MGNRSASTVSCTAAAVLLVLWLSVAMLLALLELLLELLLALAGACSCKGMLAQGEGVAPAMAAAALLAARLVAGRGSWFSVISKETTSIGAASSTEGATEDASTEETSS